MLEAFIVSFTGPLVFLFLAVLLCALVYCAGVVCYATLRGLSGGTRRCAIPPRQLRELNAALEDAERQASLGQAHAGRAELASRLAEARRQCDPDALWWGPLIGRWQSEVARYERQHRVRPAAEVAPALAPEDALAGRLLAPVEPSAAATRTD